MEKPDRAAFARKHAYWLGPAFAALTIYALLYGRLAALVAGVAGLIWVGGAFLMKK